MIRNSATTWGIAARFFHGAGALVILGLIGHGWWMTEFAPRAERMGHYQTHASFGYLLIALMVLRLLWRWMNEVPALPNAPAWERWAAHAGHWGLYVLTFGAAFSGWGLAGTFRQPIDSVFGWFQVPALASGNALHKPLEEAHELLSWTLAFLVLAHVASAFWHLWWKKDDVMQRMLR